MQSAASARAESRRNQGAAGGSRREKPAVNSRRPDPLAAASVRPAMSLRLGPRVIGEGDARHRIEQLQQDNQAEDDVPAGPICFGPRIRQEQFPKGFTLPRDTPKYNGSVKPEDWLVDYMTAVTIAGGSKRVAVRYAPLMLQGSARSWLNSLPPNNINCWSDFGDAFVRNFTGTYERPGLPGTWHSACKERTSLFVITFSGGLSSGTLAREFMKSKPSSTSLTAA